MINDTNPERTLRNSPRGKIQKRNLVSLSLLSMIRILKLSRKLLNLPRKINPENRTLLDQRIDGQRNRRKRNHPRKRFDRLSFLEIKRYRWLGIMVASLD